MTRNGFDTGVRYSPSYSTKYLLFSSVVEEVQSFLHPTSEIAGPFVVRACSAALVGPFLSRIHSVVRLIRFCIQGKDS